ncbi:MAG: hypothetical protein DMG05_18290 [Acidobacteria bacterium]|nr:MAG: hypothetical protein DMG05_18290 [Acidobacteriota bacterium]
MLNDGIHVIVTDFISIRAHTLAPALTRSFGRKRSKSRSTSKSTSTSKMMFRKQSTLQRKAFVMRTYEIVY